MVLRLLESFDHYAPTGTINDLLVRKWNRVTPVTGTPVVLNTCDINIVEGQADGSFAAEIVGTGSSAASTFYMFEWVNPDSTLPDEMVVGFWFKHDGAGVAGSVCRFNSDGSQNIGVGMNASGVLFVERSTTTIATGTTAMSTDTWYYIEAKVLIANSGGNVEVRLNRNTEINFTGDTQATSSAEVSSVQFSGINFTDVAFDDIYICDTTGSANNDFLEDGSGNGGGVRIKTLYPNGAGNRTELGVVRAASNYLAVSEASPDDDGSYVEGTATARDTYSIENLGVPTSEIFGISNEFIYRKSGPGQKLVSTVIRTGGTDFVSSNENSLMEYVSKATIYDQNPDTTSDWTESDIDSLEIGIDVFNPATFLSGAGSINADGTIV